MCNIKSFIYATFSCELVSVMLTPSHSIHTPSSQTPHPPSDRRLERTRTLLDPVVTRQVAWPELCYLSTGGSCICWYVSQVLDYWRRVVCDPGNLLQKETITAGVSSRAVAKNRGKFRRRRVVHGPGHLLQSQECVLTKVITLNKVRFQQLHNQGSNLTHTQIVLT